MEIPDKWLPFEVLWFQLQLDCENFRYSLRLYLRKTQKLKRLINLEKVIT